MKWPNCGLGKAKEHSWLPALLFSPQVFLIACKHADSLFLLLACERQGNIKSQAMVQHVLLLPSPQPILGCLTACICAAVCATSLSELLVLLLKSCIGFCCTEDHRPDFLQLFPYMGQGERED